MGLKLTKLNSDDYIKIAELHCNFINQGFLKTLGVSFLALLYESIDRDSKSMLFVERIDNSIVGFVSTTAGLGGLYKQLLLKPFRLVYSLKSCLLSPKKIYKILELLFQTKKSNAFNDLPKQELLSIVVDPAYQGRDYAKKLFQDLCLHLKKTGVKDFIIVVGNNLDRAHSFYKKMGSIPVAKTQIHKGESSIIYLKNLN